MTTCAVNQSIQHSDFSSHSEKTYPAFHVSKVWHTVGLTAPGQIGLLSQQGKAMRKLRIPHKPVFEPFLPHFRNRMSSSLSNRVTH